LAVGQTQYLISTYAGGLPGPTAAPATSYDIQDATAVTVDPFGNLYVSTTSNCVFRLDPGGNLSRVAGTCVAGSMGEGGIAVNAQLNGPQGLAVDLAGNLYIADQNNQRILQVTPAGIVSIVAGTGIMGYNGTSGQGTSIALNSPQGLAVDPAGNLYIADKGNNLVRKLAPGGTLTTIAGTHRSGTAGDGGPATSATLDAPAALALDFAGNLYIGDGSYQVRKVGPDGNISHVAGTAGVSGESGDSGPAASAQLSYPAGLAVDSIGNLYIADKTNQLIRKVNTSGNISIYAGGGSALPNGVPATQARIANPMGVTVDYRNNVYIADQASQVLVVSPGGTVTVAVGTGVFQFGGDGGPASLAQFNGPWGLALDGSNNLYAVDLNNYRVRKITLTGTQAGTISTIAGTGSNVDSGNGQQATSAGVTPKVVVADSLGNVYLADNTQVRKIALDGTISTVAGTGTAGYNGDNIEATSAQLSGYVAGLAVDSKGNLYIADSSNNRVREVSAAGIITTVAGTGTAGSSGAELSFPTGLALDAAGQNLYIADNGNCRVRKQVLGTNGAVSTVTGNGTCADTGDGTAASTAEITAPWGLALDTSGNLYIATQANKVRVVSAGVIGTIAGTGTAGYAGDGGPATAALLSEPLGLAVDSAGNVYVSDFNNNVIRILEPVGTEPLLFVSSAHTGNFIAGQAGVTFNVTVSNAALAASTSGTVTVTDTLPSSMTLLPTTNNGWNCSISNSTYTCTSSNPISAGGSSQAISAVANVGNGAQPQITNAVTVSGAGVPGSSSEDVAFVGPSVPTLEIAATHGGVFVLGEQETYSILVGNTASAPSTSGTVTVTDALPSALNLISMSGSGWNCGNSGSTTCTRSDALGGGAIYSPITVTVSVPSGAPPSVTNQATVSGGGSPQATAMDPTTIVSLACNVTGDGAANITDVQAIVNQALGVNAPVSDLNSDNVVNVVDVQIVINAALGLGCSL
jgi:uncharacterized repeat protein (TIGR01451 family)